MVESPSKINAISRDELLSNSLEIRLKPFDQLRTRVIGNGVPLMMVEEADARAFVVKTIDRQSRLDEEPTSITIGRAGTGLTAEEQDCAGSGQREQLVMVPFEVRFTALRAEIPRGVPVG